MLSKLQSEFDARKINILGITCTSSISLNGFLMDVEETQACSIRFPIVIDENGSVSDNV